MGRSYSIPFLFSTLTINIFVEFIMMLIIVIMLYKGGGVIWGNFKVQKLSIKAKMTIWEWIKSRMNIYKAYKIY